MLVDWRLRATYKTSLHARWPHAIPAQQACTGGLHGILIQKHAVQVFLCGCKAQQGGMSPLQLLDSALS